MAIAFICSCGKALKAKEAFAGRKVKCPQCNTIVRIPRLDGSPTEDTNGVAVSAPVPAALTPSRIPAAPLALEIGSSDVLPTIAPLPKPAPWTAPSESMPKARPNEGPAIHAWVDRSLAQVSTPWLPGDEERFQKGIRSPREGVSVLEIGAVGILVLVGVGAAGWFLVWNK